MDNDVFFHNLNNASVRYWVKHIIEEDKSWSCITNYQLLFFQQDFT